MRSLISGLKGLMELLLLTMLLMVGLGSSEVFAQWFSSPGGGSGGFTGRPLITVEISADKTRVPVNLAGIAPNPSLPYTSTITVVARQDGRLFPTSIQLDLAPSLATGALFDPEDPTEGFRSLPLESTSGLATAFFHASSTPGVATITASAQDPNTGQTVSASLQITVVDEQRPPAAITFTGAYVNAVIAGESQFGGAETPIQDGSYSRLVSAVVNDMNGNPANPNTQINFYLIDGPLTGYPSTPGSFYIAGSDGDPVDGQFRFNAVGGDFITKGAAPFQRLVLGRPVPDLRIIESVLSATSLAVQSTSRPPFPANTSNVPYVVGFAQNAAILSPSFTNLQGVASTILTYPVERIGQTAVLVACTADMSVCGTLNTCDANGANCKSVYLGVTNGSDRTLTVSATTLGPNRSTGVQMCLRDVNFTPLPATEIRYNIGSSGPAKVTVNGVEGNQGKVLTGDNGCTVVQIASSGQIPGGLPIELDFTADYVAEPAKITIKSPGAGKMDGFFNCEFEFSQGTALCELTLRLTDDEGSPMPDVLIALGAVEAAGTYTLTFNPAEGVFGKTDSQGQLRVTVQLDMPGTYIFPFQTAAGGTASYTMTVNVPAPGQLQVSLNGPTDAPLGQPYSAVLLAEGGVPPYVWSLLSGQLPPGLGLSAGGAITGTPTTPGTFSFAVQATDKNGLTGFGAFTITVGQDEVQALTVELTGPPTGTLNAPYSAVLGATGGIAPYSFSLLAGQLPPGVALNANGTLSGTPTEAGTFSFSVQARDSKGATGTGNFTITIASASPLTLTLEGPTATTVGAAYSGVVVPAGGTSPYTFRILAGSPPTGVSLNPATGGLSGTPIAGGVFVFTVEATDSKGVKGQGTFTITVNTAEAPAIATESPLPNATPGTFYTALFTATGGTLPYSWTIEAPSTLPASLRLNPSTGALAGTPTSAEVGTYNFIIRVTDANGAFALKSYILAVGGGTTGPTPTQLTLLTSSPDLPSSGQQPVTLTAVARDNNGVLLKDVTVTFQVISGDGALQVVRGVTDETGTAVAELSTGGNKRNRIIQVGASASGIVATPTNVNVIGTTLTGASAVAGTVPLNTPVDLTFTLRDSAGNPISNAPLAISSTPGAPGLPTNITTNSSGVVQLSQSFSVAGTYNISAAWDATGSTFANPVNLPLVIVASADSFTITVTDNVTGDPDVVQIAPGFGDITVTWLQGVTPVAGTITLTTNKGTIAPTSGANPLTATISATVPGPATITATGTSGGQTVSVQKTIQFVAVDPAELTLQANPSSIPANVPGATSSQSEIVATVRDANSNPVANINVSFEILQDVSGGSLSASTATTDFAGRAVVNYTAGTSSTPENGVIIRATVSGLPSRNVTLTVAGTQVFITLGTGNTVVEPDPTTYELPYSVLLNDISGLPVANRVVTLQVFSTTYSKGFYTWNGTVWVRTVTVTCPNEDLFYPVGDIRRNNGILDPGEDTNNNGRLDPGNVAAPSVPSVTTNASGFGFFNVVYAQQYANWVGVQLVARSQVGGTESVAAENFVLIGVSTDFNKEDVSPPGSPSPFGVGLGVNNVCTNDL